MKILKTLIVILAILLHMLLIGLIITGWKIGWGPFDFLRFNRKEVSMAEHEYIYQQETLFCKDGENKIFGTLYTPEDGKDKRGIVILSHGFNSSSTKNRFLAKSLAKSGIAVYAYDFCGGSTKGKSNGQTTEMSVMTEKSNLESVLKMIKELSWVDKDKIILFGESQGGLVTALTAAEHKEINSLVLYFPALCIIDDANSKYKNVSDIPETLTLMGMKIGKKYYSDIRNVDVFGTIGRYKGDVLICHGIADSTVPYRYSEKAVKTYQNATLYTLKGAGHGFIGKQEIEALQLVYHFMIEHVE